VRSGRDDDENGNENACAIYKLAISPPCFSFAELVRTLDEGRVLPSSSSLSLY
jgi:hypothetical protein